MPSRLENIESIRIPNEKNPLRILFSSCLLGTLCGADGSSYGTYNHIKYISKLPTVSVTHFCPEDYSFGTPREIPDIEGGNGSDVLDGNAKVINESGDDITEGMLVGARKMLEVAKRNDIELAIMMDVSAACGSQVIYKGHRLSSDPQYQIGMGVCAALLNRNDITIISQRDYKSLDVLLSKLDPSYITDKTAKDHYETEWYINYFGKRI